MASRVSVVYEPSVYYVLFLLLAFLSFSVEAKVHFHKWKVNYQTWAPDCVEVTIISINGQYPGPTIRAREGDTVVVQLENLMPTENVVIHWHGIRQIGTPWDDGTASMSQCAIYSGETYVYKFVVDRPGTYFYHGHYGLQRSAGFYGSLIVDAAGKEPFTYHGELSIVLNDWWHKSTYEQAAGLSSNPFVWVGEPQSLLIEGRGQYNCSATSKSCNATNTQCSPYILPVQPGNTYRLRIASVASLSALNFVIQGHKMTVVEADGHYVEPFEADNLDVYSGEAYSVLITANQDTSQNYWAGVNVRGRQPKTPTGLAILNYLPNPSTKLPTAPSPTSPLWNDYAYSKALAKKFVALKGHEELPPLQSHRRLILLNTQNKINGFTKWAINNISLVPPPTPYLAAMKYKIKGAYETTPPADVYSPRDYNIRIPPPNPNAVEGNGVYDFKSNSVVDVILQNANTLNVNNSEIHPWHLHGHDFWILGYGEGVFDPAKDPVNYNTVNPPLRNTVALFPYGWTALRFKADNPGVWAFHCHLEAHFFMGMGVMFAEGIEKVRDVPRAAMGCGLTKNKIHMHH
ncbi:L-ascorbate oxidase [Cryptomeria japonica]|uniref:L-ascorbate oxidase n=1 Tax=Cryptomeria japonica TaxID=3369 RepID=UPI0027DA77E9|nr:L-ascorbate oxidase [Cryptomeria japonica]